jgi:hypothetical protein
MLRYIVILAFVSICAGWSYHRAGKYGLALTICEEKRYAFSGNGATINTGKNDDLYRIVGDSLPHNTAQLVGRDLFILRGQRVVLFDIIDGWVVSDEEVEICAPQIQDLPNCHYAICNGQPFDLKTLEYVKFDPKRGFNWDTCKEYDIPTGGVFVRRDGNLVIYKTPDGYHAFNPTIVAAAPKLHAISTADAGKILVRYAPNEFDVYSGMVAVTKHEYVRNAEMLRGIINDAAAGDASFTISVEMIEDDDGNEVAQVSIIFNIKYVDTPFTMLLHGDTDRVNVLDRRVKWLLSRAK